MPQCKMEATLIFYEGGLPMTGYFIEVSSNIQMLASIYASMFGDHRVVIYNGNTLELHK